MGMVISSAVIILITGICILFATFYFAFSDFGQNTGYSQIFLWTGIIETIVIITIFVIGVIAGARPNKPLLGVYIGFIFIILAAYLFILAFII